MLKVPIPCRAIVLNGVVEQRDGHDGMVRAGAA